MGGGYISTDMRNNFVFIYRRETVQKSARSAKTDLKNSMLAICVYFTGAKIIIFYIVETLGAETVNA